MYKRRGKMQDKGSAKGGIPEISDDIPEISDDDMRKEDPGYHIPLSRESKSWTEKPTLKLTQETSVNAFWNDQKIWILLGIFLVIQLMTVVYFKLSMEKHITNLKSCQKRVANSDASLPCSDCMCIATDGFSSKEFLDIIGNQQKDREKYKELEKANNVVRSQLSEYQKQVAEFEGTLSEYKTKNNDDHVSELFHINWEKKKDIFTEEIKKIETSLRHLLNQVEEDVKKNFQNVLSQINEQRQEITEVEEKIQPVDDLKAQLENRMDKIEKEKKRLMNEHQELEKKQELFEERLGGVERQQNFVYKEINDINLYIILFLVLVVIAVIFAFQKLLLYRQPPHTISPVEAQSMRSGPNQGVGGQEVSRSELLAKVSSKKSEKGIGVISFHSSTQEFHQNLLRVVSKPHSLPMQTYLIEKQQDLLTVKPYKVTIIFVDFNERNIILENPDTEVGDCRRLTTEIFLESKCDVFVVYCKDKDSQSLPPNQLYNAKLHSIKQQPILSKLSKENRVFSVNKALLPQQVQLLENCFKQL